MRLEIAKDTVTPALRRMLARAGGLRPVYAVGAMEVERQLKLHLKRLQMRGNKMGWPSRMFFYGRPDSVVANVRTTSLTNQGATVAIDDYRFTHRIKGGTVFPKNAKALAIPMTLRAYRRKGPLRQTWPELRLAAGKLVIGKKSVPQYQLKRSVTHKPKPDEVPDKRVIGPPVIAAMRRYMINHLGLREDKVNTGLVRSALRKILP